MMNTSETFSIHNATTEAVEVRNLDLYDNYKQLYLDIEWWMMSVSHIFFPIIGGFGNILTFIVMQRGSLNEVSTCFYMSVLALADTGKCISEGCLSVSVCLCWDCVIQVNTSMKDVSVCFYMSMLALPDRGK